jgi:tetratricopeptide (TPR) repeat protein
VVRAYSERAGDPDGVLDALGTIAADLRRDLGESLASIRQSSLSLPRVTTPSLHALELYAEGLGLWRKGAYREAVRLYESAVQSDPCFAMAHATLGAAYFSHIYSDPVKGEKHYEEALRCSGRVTERERLLIQASHQGDLGHLAEAFDQYRMYLAMYPDDVSVRYNYGSLLMRNNRPEQAIEELKEVVRVAPTHARAFINIATAYRALGRSDQALPYYAKAFDLEPGLLKVANVVHEYGFGLVHSGDLVRAREVFLRAVEGHSLRASALRSLALLDMYEGKYADAKVRLHESILLAEGEKDVLKAARGRLYMSMLLDGQGDRAGALRELDGAARSLESLKAPQDWLYMRVGALYARAGAVARAERILTKVRDRVDPKNAQENSLLHLLGGEVALARGRYRLAVESALLAHRKAGTPETLASLANACDRAGDPKQAVEYYNNLIAQASPSLGWEPQQAWIAAHARLAEIYLLQNERSKAAAALDILPRIWSKADPGLPLAKRISSLQSRLPSGAEAPFRE